MISPEPSTLVATAGSAGPRTPDAGAPLLRVSELHKTFRTETGPAGGGALKALEGVSFDVESGEVFTLLGPSGCGKSTTLRAVAGIERPDEGTIVLRGRTLFDSAQGIWVRANSRRLGMVFQTYAIWPHMTVFENVAFPLRAAPRSNRLPERDIRQRVHEVLEMVGLGYLEARPATQLSGGQQQRVAVARALVGQPDIVLLDEPFSNLDTKLRESMRLEMQRLQKELGLTVVFVTHDQTEALALSDRIAVLRDGKVCQVGSPQELYSRPRNVFVAEATGAVNTLPGVVSASSGDTCTVETAAGAVRARAGESVARDAEVDVVVRPESVRVSADQASVTGEVNSFPGKVIAVSYQGDVVEHLVSLGKANLRAKMDATGVLDPGRDVRVFVPPEEAWALPR